MLPSAFSESRKSSCSAKCAAEMSDFNMENQNVLGTFSEGGRSPECFRQSKEVGQHREKIMCNSR